MNMIVVKGYLWDKVRYYWEHLWEHIETLEGGGGINWERIRNICQPAILHVIVEQTVNLTDNFEQEFR
jgi:hypothetical protein